MKKIIIAACLIGLSAPSFVEAQPSQRHARRENRAAARSVDDRIGRTIAAVTTAEGRGIVAHRRADAMRNELDRMRADYMRNKRDQGFVSAGELSSYNRTLYQMEREVRRK